MIALASPAPPSPAAADVEAPIIEDIAAASSSPETAPVVTVMMSDRGSGVGDAFVVYRATGGTDWGKAPLLGNADAGSSLFIAHLPDGLQRTGFEYYVEASDKAGNGPARIGSPEEPVAVGKATVPTRERLQRQTEADAAGPVGTIHPGWIMLALGTGVLASAGASAYVLDLSISNGKKTTAESELHKDPSANRRADLERARDGYQNAIVQDGAIASVLGVIGLAGLATGVALLIVANLE